MALKVQRRRREVKIMQGIKIKTKYYFQGVCTIFVLSLFVLSMPLSTFGREELDEKKDKDKTVWTIGSSEDKQQQEDKDKAWDMLKNMNLWMDNRNKK